MSLRLLLDENLSPTIVDQIRQHRSQLTIESVHTWRNGAFRGIQDRELLNAAFVEALTLITYDQKTIPRHLADMYAAGEDHAGVIFIDNYTIESSNFGMLTRSIILFFDSYRDESWENRVAFLEKSQR